MVTVVYEPKTPDLYSGESGGIRTVTHHLKPAVI
jgi:hypothetical protein